VLKDGHLFVIHILDPQLETGEEVPLPETEMEETITEPNSSRQLERLLLLVARMQSWFQGGPDLQNILG